MQKRNGHFLDSTLNGCTFSHVHSASHRNDIALHFCAFGDCDIAANGDDIAIHCAALLNCHITQDRYRRLTHLSCDSDIAGDRYDCFPDIAARDRRTEDRHHRFSRFARLQFSRASELDDGFAVTASPAFCILLVGCHLGGVLCSIVGIRQRGSVFLGSGLIVILRRAALMREENEAAH